VELVALVAITVVAAAIDDSDLIKSRFICMMKVDGRFPSGIDLIQTGDEEVCSFTKASRLTWIVEASDWSKSRRQVCQPEGGQDGKGGECTKDCLHFTAAAKS